MISISFEKTWLVLLPLKCFEFCYPQREETNSMLLFNYRILVYHLQLVVQLKIVKFLSTEVTVFSKNLIMSGDWKNAKPNSSLQRKRHLRILGALARKESKVFSLFFDQIMHPITSQESWNDPLKTERNLLLFKQSCIRRRS